MLEINNLKFSYGSEDLFNNVEMRILNGEHVGLIGRNGSGKTTLMNLIAHKLSPDNGVISWDKNTTFSYLDQHLKIYDDLTIQNYLYNVYEDLFKKEDDMNALYASMETANPQDYDKILRKAENIQNFLEENDFYMIKSKISNIINGLGISVSENKLLRELSGGQRAKVFLGKMLLEEKDVLLLDEPTNFLDITHVDWLAKFLVNYKNAFIVISHNNDFLNSICNVIVSLDNKKLTKYKGNYNDYLHQKAMNEETYYKEYQKQQKYIKKTEAFINKNIVRATTTKRAQSRRKMLEKLDVLEKPQSEKKISFEFQFTKSFNSNVLETIDLSIGYEEPILENLSLKFEFGHKYVITGKNGIGKTTFLKTILNEIPLKKGKVKLSTYNDILYFKQEEQLLNFTPIEYIRNDYPLFDDKKIRSLLAKYAITGQLAIKSMGELSGGEAAKVRFAKLSLTSSNLLILDEPTNHLDKVAKKSLFAAIEKYPGTVILVSHEKQFYKDLNMEEIKF